MSPRTKSVFFKRRRERDTLPVRAGKSFEAANFSNSFFLRRVLKRMKRQTARQVREPISSQKGSAKVGIKDIGYKRKK